MEKYEIRFESVEDVQNFIKWAEKCPFDLDISAGSIHLDAKSIQGLLAMSLCKDMILTVHGKLSEDDLNVITAWQK